MVNDMDLRRKLLFEIAKRPKEAPATKVRLEGYDQKTIDDQLIQLRNDGYIVATAVKAQQGEPNVVTVRVRNLTENGASYVKQLKDDAILPLA